MKNEGIIDRVARVVLGLVLLSGLLLLYMHGLKYWPGWVGVIGLYPLTTGLTGNCPLLNWLDNNAARETNAESRRG